MIGYIKPDPSIWTGRIDCETDYDSYRWHQIVECMDLSKPIKKAKTDLSFVIIGYQIDEGIRLNGGRVGAIEGPNSVREFLCNKPCSFSEEVHIYDGGNVILAKTVEDAQRRIARLVTKCIEKKYFPILIGGGHDLSYGTMLGLKKSYDLTKKKLGIINFDAHFDLRPYHQSTSGTMFRQIYDDFTKEKIRFNHMTVGIQKSSNTRSLFTFAQQIKSKYILARELGYYNMPINRYKVSEFVDKQDLNYISVCMDVFGSAYAPGVSSPSAIGITPEVFMELFKTIVSKGKTVAFDIAEISPPNDLSKSTPSLGALIIYTLINYLSEMKEGY